MTSYYLIRVLAMASMLSDHLGVFFFHDLPVLRSFGRIAFPLYAFGVSCGWLYTRKRISYLVRLAVIALLAQVFCLYDVINVVVGFVAVLGWLAASEFLGRKPLGQAIAALLWIVVCIGLIAFNVDYALETMVLVPLNCRLIALWMSSGSALLWLPSLLYVVVEAAFANYSPPGEGGIPLWSWLPALVAPIVVASHKTATGRVAPWFKMLYTWFYPLHWFVLFVYALSATSLS